MRREALRRNATSPSPDASPTPPAVAALTARKDVSLSFVTSAPFRDVASPMSASHASLSTDPVHATLSPRPMSPAAYRIDSANTHSNIKAAHAPSCPRDDGIHHVNNPSQSISATPSSSSTKRLSSTFSTEPSRTDKAAERAFYRRILFQDLSASTEAPSITDDADLNHEIYLLLAYLLRETVLPWYSKLTPDRELLTQITLIITSIINTVIERQAAGSSASAVSSTASESDIHAPRSASHADLPRIHTMLSRDIPLILRQHCLDFRQAQAKAESTWAPLGAQSASSVASNSLSQADSDERLRQQVLEQLSPFYQEAFDPLPSATRSVSALQLALHFQATSPHPGLNPATGSLDGKIDLAYLRIAVLNLLSSLLPADEFAPDTEKFIVRDVLVTVLRGALARSFRPWFFVQSLHKALDAAGWPADPTPPPVESHIDTDDSARVLVDRSAVAGRAPTAVLRMITRLPAMLLHAWTLIIFTALPFLVRAYLDLFNVQRARRRRTQHQPRPDKVSTLLRSSSVKGGMSSSLSTGSFFERKMHGRYPSHRFHSSNDDTITAQGHLLASDVNFSAMLDPHDVVQDGAKEEGKRTVDDRDLAPDYVGNWLDILEEVLLTNTHAVLRALLGLMRTAVVTSGLAESMNRMLMRRINSELRNTQKLSQMVRELRRILLPDGHLPPSVPDPDIETQETEWIRLRARLVCATAGPNEKSQKAFVPWLVKRMLLGSADDGLSRGDSDAGLQDIQIQVQRLTMWLEPFCSPQAAGPNTLLAILLFERVVAAICPDLTLS